MSVRMRVWMSQAQFLFVLCLQSFVLFKCVWPSSRLVLARFSFTYVHVVQSTDLRSCQTHMNISHFQTSESFKEITGSAHISVSSYKPGFGVSQLMDPSTDLFWQYVSSNSTNSTLSIDIQHSINIILTLLCNPAH